MTIPDWYKDFSVILTSNFIVFGVIIAGATLLQTSVNHVRRIISSRTK
jgi:hypothetical protein